MKRLVLLFAFLLAACAPGPDPNNPKWYQWSRDAIHAEFGRFGSSVEKCALEIAQHESGLWPFANNSDTWLGIFQLSKSKQPGINQAAYELGREPNFFDPLQNSRVARWLFEGDGRSFQNHWAGAAPGWCP